MGAGRYSETYEPEHEHEHEHEPVLLLFVLLLLLGRISGFGFRIPAQVCWGFSSMIFLPPFPCLRLPFDHYAG
jgi:hypothetical protein